MRNLKKLLALVVVLALSVSFVLPAMAKSITDFPDGADGLEFLKTKGNANVQSQYIDAIQLLIDLDVVAGSSNPDGPNTLNLDKPLSRAEFAALLYKSMNGGVGIEENPQFPRYANMVYFSDPALVLGAAYPTAYVNWFTEQGITAGYPDGTFRPNANITYLEAVLFCLKAIGLQTDLLVPAFNFSADTIRIQRFADWADILGVTFPMGGADTGLIDRATAFLLLSYVMESEMIEHIVPGNPLNFPFGKPSGGGEWIESKFGLRYGTFVITSVNDWFAIEGATGNRVNIRKLNGDQNGFTGNNINTNGRLGLNLTIEDVGRAITLRYRADGDAIASIVTSARFVSDADTAVSYDVFENADGRRLRNRFGLADDANVRLFNNYVHTDSGNADSFSGAAEATGAKIESDKARLVKAGNINYVFIEKYTAFQVGEFADNGNEFANSGAAAGILNGKKRGDVLNGNSVARYDYALAYAIGGGKAGVIKLDATRGKINFFNNDKSEIGLVEGPSRIGPAHINHRIGGTNFGFNGTAGVWTLNMGDDVSVVLWQGRAVASADISVTPGPTLTQYAFVIRSFAWQPAQTPGQADPPIEYWVDMIDTSTGERALYKINELLQSGGGAINASDNVSNYSNAGPRYGAGTNNTSISIWTAANGNTDRSAIGLTTTGTPNAGAGSPQYIFQFNGIRDGGVRLQLLGAYNASNAGSNSAFEYRGGTSLLGVNTNSFFIDNSFVIWNENDGGTQRYHVYRGRGQVPNINIAASSARIISGNNDGETGAGTALRFAFITNTTTRPGGVVTPPGGWAYVNSKPWYELGSTGRSEGFLNIMTRDGEKRLERKDPNTNFTDANSFNTISGMTPVGGYNRLLCGWLDNNLDLGKNRFSALNGAIGDLYKEYNANFKVFVKTNDSQVNLPSVDRIFAIDHDGNFRTIEEGNLAGLFAEGRQSRIVLADEGKTMIVAHSTVTINSDVVVIDAGSETTLETVNVQVTSTGANQVTVAFSGDAGEFEVENSSSPGGLALVANWAALETDPTALVEAIMAADSSLTLYQARALYHFAPDYNAMFYENPAEGELKAGIEFVLVDFMPIIKSMSGASNGAGLAVRWNNPLYDNSFVDNVLSNVSHLNGAMATRTPNHLTPPTVQDSWLLGIMVHEDGPVVFEFQIGGAGPWYRITVTSDITRP
jgi:hypothetical protein